MALQTPFRLSASTFDRPDPETDDVKTVIFISTEGTETEPDYFDHLNSSLKRKLLANNKVSNNNTESSILLSRHAHHGKNIAKPIFEKIYLSKIRHASNRAKKLATNDTDVLSNLGTRVPVIVNPLLPWL